MGQGHDQADHEEVIGWPQPIGAVYNDSPCLILCMNGDVVVIVKADGELWRVPHEQLTVDWRYDDEQAIWVDIGPNLYEAVEDGESDQEEADDGGEEVP